jgi:hypothetical protein
MTYENLDMLSRIYNTLLLINTKGEDTLLMAECLVTLKNLVLTEKEKINKRNEEEEA